MVSASDTFSYKHTLNIVITEIMYNTPETPTDNLEFIEIYNNDTAAVDLSGWTMLGVTDTFPSTILNPGDYFITCRYASTFQNFFGIPVHQWLGGNLSNNGESIALINPTGDTIDIVNYDNISPWPTEPNGAGPSLVLCDYNADNNDATNWLYSTQFTDTISTGDSLFASPGSADSACIQVSINKFSDENNIICYPNPSSGIFNICLNHSVTGKLEILNIYGQTILQLQNNFIPQCSYQIDLSDDGTMFDSTGIRYKGYSSWNANEIKNPFNISLDYIIEGQNYHGISKIKLSLANLDSYIGYAPNYYLYMDNNGRFNPVVWDLNMSFGSFRNSDGSNNFNGLTIDKAKNLNPLQHLTFSIKPRPLMKNLFQNNTFKRMYLAHMRTILNENFVNNEYYSRGQELQSMINVDVQNDTNKFYSYADFINNLDTTVGGTGEMIEYPGIADLMQAWSIPVG